MDKNGSGTTQPWPCNKIHGCEASSGKLVMASCDKGGSGRRWATTASAPRALLRFGCGCGERGFVDRSGGGGGRRHRLALVADEQRPRPVAYWRVRDERGLAPTIPFCLRIRLVFLCPSSQAAASRVCPMNCTLHSSQNISLQFRSSHGDLVMLILL